MLNPQNPFGEIGPAAPNPDEERRKLIQAALAQSLGAPKDNSAALASNEQQAKDLGNQSQLIKSGVILGDALMGRRSTGDNLGSQMYDDQAKGLLAKNLEMKKSAEEEAKRRADIAKAFGLQDVQDASQLDRQNKNNADQIARDNNQNAHTVGRDKTLHGYDRENAAQKFGYDKELLGVKAAADANKPKDLKPMEAAFINELKGYDDTDSLMAQANALVGTVQPGPGESLVQAAARKFGADSPEFSEFKAVLGTALGDRIKTLSGTAANESEVKRIRENTPNESDSPATFQRKMNFFLKYTADKRNSTLNTLEKAGRDVTGFRKATSAGKESAKTESATNNKVSAEDQAAIDWAKENPNDPRAAQILKLHGG